MGEKLVDEETRKLLIKNHKEVSNLLLQNEDIIRAKGFLPPTENYVIDKKDRISIPRGYIRTSSAFWKKYRLNEICILRSTKDNISYALQLSDFYNYLINRFNIWGSVETLLYKQSFINIISIIEALIIESCTNINLYCKKCKKINSCNKNINKNEREHVKSAIAKLFDLSILQMTEDRKNRLIELVDLRNKVHIRLQLNNEFVDDKFNLSLYNESVIYLQEIAELLFANAIKYYNNCLDFTMK